MFKSKKKVITLVLSVVLLSAVTVFALWYVRFSGITGLMIHSEEPIVFSHNFGMTSIDTTNSSYNETKSLSIQNKDGDRWAVVEYSVDWVDVDTDSCVLEEGVDSNAVVKFDSNPINSSEYMLITAGVHTVDVELSAVQDSCPHNLTVFLNITGDTQ